MKKLILISSIIFSQFMFSQENYFKGRDILQPGRFSIGLNTSSLSYDDTDNVKSINIGLNAGIFVFEKFEAKINVSGDIRISKETSAVINYSAGVKYYADYQFPLYVGYYGADAYTLKNIKSYLQVGAGYSYFVSDFLSIEPNVNYFYSPNNHNRFNFNLSLNLFF